MILIFAENFEKRQNRVLMTWQFFEQLIQVGIRRPCALWHQSCKKLDRLWYRFSSLTNFFQLGNENLLCVFRAHKLSRNKHFTVGRRAQSVAPNFCASKKASQKLGVGVGRKWIELTLWFVQGSRVQKKFMKSTPHENHAQSSISKY